jgi:CheY-like chemotaxis protein
MNGEIGVESEELSGSTFWFTAEYGIPIQSLDNSAGEIHKSGWEGHKQSILLAEDNPINQRVALYNLTKLGHKVDIAQNGQEAVAMVQSHSYDIVLMDIQMPLMSGLEATKAIRQWENDSGKKLGIPIIAMTADALLGNMERYLAEGMSGFISKPFKLRELENVLKNAIESKSGKQ